MRCFRLVATVVSHRTWEQNRKCDSDRVPPLWWSSIELVPMESHHECKIPQQLFWPNDVYFCYLSLPKNCVVIVFASIFDPTELIRVYRPCFIDSNWWQCPWIMSLMVLSWYQPWVNEAMTHTKTYRISMQMLMLSQVRICNKGIHEQIQNGLWVGRPTPESRPRAHYRQILETFCKR